MEIDYQVLVEGYYENLHTNLRHFKGGPGFLETWAHDEDHNRSLLEILDLAHSQNVEKLSIVLPAQIANELDFEWLKTHTAKLGFLDLADGKLHFEGRVKGQCPVYEKSLRKRAENLCFEGFSMLEDCLTAEEGGCRLHVCVSQEGLVLAARHEGGQGSQRALLDCFCEILVGRPLQEGAEHGGIRLEKFLRDPETPPTVPGLVTPDNADPAFRLPSRLIRKIFADSSQGGKRNTWSDPVQGSWLALGEEQKLERARSLLAEGIAALGMGPALVLKVRNDTRLVLSFQQEAGQPDFGRGMIRLEQWLRQHSGLPFELQVESSEDRNRRETRTSRALE